MDVVFFREFLRQGTAEGIEVCEGVLGDLGTGCAAQEETGFGVFGGFGGFFVEGSFGAGIAGFSGES